MKDPSVDLSLSESQPSCGHTLEANCGSISIHCFARKGPFEVRNKLEVWGFIVISLPQVDGLGTRSSPVCYSLADEKIPSIC